MEALQLKINLNNTAPQIWRRILIKSDITFLELHISIQLAMGWKNSHLFEFMVNDTSIALETEDDDLFDDTKLYADEELVFDFLNRVGTNIKYVYDFGDDWEHTITLEAILMVEPKQKYPVCIDGAMNCPPEDSGSIFGFYDKLDILNDPTHPEYKEVKKWMGTNYNPELFDIKATNKQLKKIARILNSMFE